MFILTFIPLYPLTFISITSQVKQQIVFVPVFAKAYHSPEFMFSIVQVEAGEKKKKKTGRAKRRLQYNRRFVNVVATFGKRRGPNSNTPAS